MCVSVTADLFTVAPHIPLSLSSLPPRGRDWDVDGLRTILSPSLFLIGIQRLDNPVCLRTRTTSARAQQPTCDVKACFCCISVASAARMLFSAADLGALEGDRQIHIAVADLLLSCLGGWLAHPCLHELASRSRFRPCCRLCLPSAFLLLGFPEQFWPAVLVQDQLEPLAAHMQMAPSHG